MEVQIERLRQRINNLRHRLIWIETEKIRAEIEAEYDESETAERTRWALRLCTLVADSEAVQAELTAALTRLAHLKVAAEMELLAKQPAQIQRHIREDREWVERVLERHRKIARRMIRDATDDDLSMARFNGEDVAAIRERQREQRRQRKQQQLEAELKQDDGPRQRYRGPSM